MSAHTSLFERFAPGVIVAGNEGGSAGFATGRPECFVSDLSALLNRRWMRTSALLAGALALSAAVSPGQTKCSDQVEQNINLTSGTTSYVGVNCIQAAGNSTSGAPTTFTVNSGAGATFQAGQTIYLEPGFHAASGSGFRAFIAPAALTPTITSISPSSAPAGTSVTITGTNFGA